MVDSLLRLQYAATDAVGATAALRAVTGSAEVSAAGATMSWKQVSLVDDGITISRIEARGERVHVSVPRTSELLVVSVHAGSVQLRNGEFQLALGRGDLGLIPIDASADLHLDAAGFDLFSFPPAPLARLLGVPKHAVQLHAPRATPRTAALAEYFRRTAQLLTSSVFGEPEVYGRDLPRTHTIDLLAAVTVDAFELTNRSEDDTSRDMAVLRRAIAILRSHLAEPISIPEVAERAGVSVRGLQLIFHRQLGVSPLLHLRQLRLEAARQALLHPDADGVTVADIARRFGYANAGRFSSHYRDAYGESPASSIARIRSNPMGTGAEVGEADAVQRSSSTADSSAVGTPGASPA